MTKNVWIFLLMVFTCWIFSIVSCEVGKKIGFENGVSNALDTVLVIVENQINSPTVVTDLGIVGSKPDTIHYFLSKKTIK